MTRGVVVASHLTRRFGAKVALADCTFDVPDGAICGLVGPNGAGKTTLLRILAGLSRPSAGEVRVLGRLPEQDPSFLAGVGYLAQNAPLWAGLSAEEHLRICSRLNSSFATGGAAARLARCGVDTGRPVRTLSGGERAQVALSLALAKQPRLLLLDEPVAALDPLARRTFMSTLVEAVADTGMTVLISSHLVGDLERICDHLLLLSASRVQLCGDITEILSAHKLLTGPGHPGGPIAGVEAVVEDRSSPRETVMLVRRSGPVPDPAWGLHEVTLEEVVVAYMGSPGVGQAPILEPVGGAR